MDETLCIREFEKLAGRLGIEVRSIPGAPSGLCTVKGKRILFVDKTLDRNSVVAVFVREFRELELEGVFVVPLIRKLLEGENEHPVR
ncbi:MAG: hypothetical protein ACYC9O_00020 [Candidatus Latescibacterota bacterium]